MVLTPIDTAGREEIPTILQAPATPFSAPLQCPHHSVSIHPVLCPDTFEGIAVKLVFKQQYNIRRSLFYRSFRFPLVGTSYFKYLRSAWLRLAILRLWTLLLTPCIVHLSERWYLLAPRSVLTCELL